MEKDKAAFIIHYSKPISDDPRYFISQRSTLSDLLFVCSMCVAENQHIAYVAALFEWFTVHNPNRKYTYLIRQAKQLIRKSLDTDLLNPVHILYIEITP